MRIKFRTDIGLALVSASFFPVIAWKSGFFGLLGYPVGTIIIGTIAAILGVASFKLAQVHPRKLLQGRPPLSVESIFRQYYTDSGLNQPDFQKHWLEIAKALGEPPESLRPSDRFLIELPARGHFDWSNDDLVDYAQGILGREFDFETISSLDQLVRALCKRQTQTQEN